MRVLSQHIFESIHVFFTRSVCVTILNMMGAPRGLGMRIAGMLSGAVYHTLKGMLVHSEVWVVYWYKLSRVETLAGTNFRECYWSKLDLAGINFHERKIFWFPCEFRPFFCTFGSIFQLVTSKVKFCGDFRGRPKKVSSHKTPAGFLWTRYAYY